MPWSLAVLGAKSQRPSGNWWLVLTPRTEDCRLGSKAGHHQGIDPLMLQGSPSTAHSGFEGSFRLAFILHSPYSCALQKKA
ncbi:unnamed protein product [Penicillium camemberti]|uniref:Str. FM013 n=1 Tax=Penicillium camemberti (strain FM 013) TaxID=1429867 RepID=A0A0G4P984_PENC3|nr:unnamed protein product [Penicillium camemberti]